MYVPQHGNTRRSRTDTAYAGLRHRGSTVRTRTGRHRNIKQSRSSYRYSHRRSDPRAIVRSFEPFRSRRDRVSLCLAFYTIVKKENLLPSRKNRLCRVIFGRARERILRDLPSFEARRETAVNQRRRVYIKLSYNGIFSVSRPNDSAKLKLLFHRNISA